MAILTNQLHSIEPGCKIWLHIVNFNFENMYSKASFDAVIALYSVTGHTHTGYKARSVAETEVGTAMATTFAYDITHGSLTTSIVVLDRTTATYKRMYVSNGVLLVEDE